MKEFVYFNDLYIGQDILRVTRLDRGTENLFRGAVPGSVVMGGDLILEVTYDDVNSWAKDYINVMFLSGSGCFFNLTVKVGTEESISKLERKYSNCRINDYVCELSGESSNKYKLFVSFENIENVNKECS